MPRDVLEDLERALAEDLDPGPQDPDPARNPDGPAANQDPGRFDVFSRERVDSVFRGFGTRQHERPRTTSDPRTDPPWMTRGRRSDPPRTTGTLPTTTPGGSDPDHDPGADAAGPGLASLVRVMGWLLELSVEQMSLATRVAALEQLHRPRPAEA